MALAILLAAVPSIVGAESTPQLVKLQGFLSDKSGGNPVPATGTFSMSFTLFDVAVGGSPIAAVGPTDVEVTDGIYDVSLPLPYTSFDGAERFLEIVVDGETLAPRIRLASAPFAFVAERLGPYGPDDLEESSEIVAMGAALQSEIDVINLLAPADPPGGVQFKQGQIFGAESEFTYDPGADQLSVGRISLGAGSPDDVCLDWQAVGDPGICWDDTAAGFRISAPDDVLRLQGFESLHVETSVGEGPGASSLIVAHDGIEVGDPTLGQPTTIHGPLDLRQSVSMKRLNETFYCGFDWDGDGALGAADVVSCLDAASAWLTQAENGTDNAVRIVLPSGKFPLCSATACPYALESGMQLEGVTPRLQVLPLQAPDLDMRPNGGTWFDCGGQTCFGGDNLRGFTLRGVGFTNWGAAVPAVEFGGPNAVGLAFSRFEDVYFVDTNTDPTGEAALKLWNIQHVQMNFLKCYDVVQCLEVIQDNASFSSGNSVLIEPYAYQRGVFGAFDGVFQFRCVNDDPSDEQPVLNLISIVRPQVNAFLGGPAPDQSLIQLEAVSGDCAVNGFELYGMDLEGNRDTGLRLDGVVTNGYFSVSADSSGLARHVWAGPASQRNILMSSSGGARLCNENFTNTILGHWNRVESTPGCDSEGKIRGVWRADEESGVDLQVRSGTGRFSGNIKFIDQPGEHALIDVDGIFQSETDQTPLFHGLRLRPAVAATDSPGGASYGVRGASVEFFVIGGQNDDPEDIRGVDVRPVLEIGGPPGDPVQLERLYGYRFSPMVQQPPNPGETQLSIVDTYGYHVDAPSVFDPAQVEFANLYGFYVEDLDNTGTNTEALVVEAQGGGCGGDNCNVRIEGVGFDTGHLVVGDQHVWDDGTGGLRVKDGPPQGNLDGGRIVTTQSAQLTIVDPDQSTQATPAVPLLAVEPAWAPGGVKLLQCGIKLDVDTVTYSVDFEERTGPGDPSPSPVVQVTAVNAYEAQDDGTLSDPDLAAGSILFFRPPATDVGFLQVWCNFSVN